MSSTPQACGFPTRTCTTRSWPAATSCRKRHRRHESRRICRRSAGASAGGDDRRCAARHGGRRSPCLHRLPLDPVDPPGSHPDGQRRTMTSGRSGPVVQRRTSRDGGAPWQERLPETAVRLSPCRRARRKRSWRQPTMPNMGSLPPIDLAPRKRSSAAGANSAPLSAPAIASAEMNKGFDAPDRSWRSAPATSRASEIGQLLMSQQFGQWRWNGEWSMVNGGW